jgi:CDP-glucose 4,6-dehydratase
MGAKIYGYALNPPTKPNLFEQAKIFKLLEENTIADIRDFETLSKSIKESKPDIIIHMAAQPLVRDSYIIPRETYEINVMGTVNLLEAVRKYYRPKVLLNITTDKVYENKETTKGYIETDPLGGYDPYSSSKACSELVTFAYRSSFFPLNYTSKNPYINASKKFSKPPYLYTSILPLISSARAGNVIGGGDWAKDRLIPDILRAVLKNEKVLIRNPYSIRPWQHVLESLSGYLLLCEKMYNGGQKYVGAWNFGPDEKDLKTVEWIVKKLLTEIKPNKGYKISKGPHPHEAKLLVLNPEKSKKLLGWKSRWNLEYSLKKIAEWFNEYRKGRNPLQICEKQIKEYMKKFI